MNPKYLISRCGVLFASFWLQSVEAKTPVASERVEAEHAVISYEFYDQRSAEKEAEFTDLLNAGFSYYVKLFGGLPRDLSGQTYNNFRVTVRHGRGFGDGCNNS